MQRHFKPTFTTCKADKLNYADSEDTVSTPFARRIKQFDNNNHNAAWGRVKVRIIQPINLPSASKRPGTTIDDDV